MKIRRNIKMLLGVLAMGIFPWGMAFATGDAPLSAIGWLSDSVDLPEVEDQPQPHVPFASLPGEITVMALDAPLPDRAGLRPATDFGLDPGLWGRTSASDLARTLATLNIGADAPPSLLGFLRDLLTLELDPPIDAVVDDSFFLARVDRLLAMGQLDLAGQLIVAADDPRPAYFRRTFDIALLTGTETDACRQIGETPDLSPTYPARIFCLARLGEWDVAALTLGNAEALGILSDDEDQLLLHFLDPELFEGDPLPQAPRLPSPLLFRLYEAVGERIPTGELPVAFAVADLSDIVGWQARLKAAERLTAVDALPIERLIEVFSERKPAASGGIFDRVAAVRALQRALDKRDIADVQKTLPAAWRAANLGGFKSAFAPWVADRIEGLELDQRAAHLAFEIALWAGRPQLAADFATEKDRFLLAVALGQGNTGPAPDDLGRAVLRGLSAIGPGSAYQALIDDGRTGEALLRAISQLQDGAAGNPKATTQSLALLRHIGLEALARRIAVELVLKEGAA
ncbi:MAG: hypothetical protein HKN18_16790 [Silicimonas sp.]|nr:hypothetical protein [Silicimonas sp.]